MKLILASAGLYTQDIADKLANLVGKDLNSINIAIINEASAVESGDKRWLLDEMDRLRKYVGGEIDFINLLALDIDTIESRLEFADVIYVVGGVTDYLMSVYEKSGFADLLRNGMLDSKVYVGSSAGSMVIGHRISTDEYKEIYREGDLEYGVTDYMSLVEFAVFPHLNSPIFTRNRKEVIEAAAKGYPYDIYAVEDTQAVVFDRGDISFVGGDALKIT